MRTFIDINGNRYGKLTVLHLMENDRSRCVALCDCGSEIIATRTDIMRGDTTSCGCGRVRHGLWGTPEYKIWRAIIDRCESSKHIHYNNYGGRGIRICKRWKDNVHNFIEDMGKRPSKKHSIDRVDNNGDYEPSNCRWSTMKEQHRNTRTNRIVEAFGRAACIAEWAERTGLNPGTLLGRINAGWSPEKALSTPVKLKVLRPY